jgi:ribosomal protein L40E
MARMESIVKEKNKCLKCGCTAVPDATKCPNCNTVYNHHEKQETFTNDNPYPAELKNRKSKTQLVTARYQLICPVHGKINIRSTTTSSLVKCPFC